MVNKLIKKEITMIKIYRKATTINAEEFDGSINKFIKDKHVIQISTGDTILPYEDLTYTLTILYEED